MNNIDIMAKIEANNMALGLDSEITLGGSEVTLNMIDIKSGTSIGIITAPSLEDAYANMFSKFADHIRSIKTSSKFEGLSQL